MIPFYNATLFGIIWYQRTFVVISTLLLVAMVSKYLYILVSEALCRRKGYYRASALRRRDPQEGICH